MIEIIFKLKKEEYKINYNEPKTIKEIFEEFAQEHSLDINKIFLIDDNGEKVNLETGLYIEQQFNICQNEDKKLKFRVCFDTKFQVIFKSSSYEVPIKINLNDKMKDALKKFSEKEKIDLANIFVLYNGNYAFDYENVGDKNIIDLINGNDKKENAMTLSIVYKDINSQHSSFIQDNPNIINNKNDFSENNYNNFNEKLIGFKEGINNNGEGMIIKRKFYFKIFLISMIQYVCIISLCIAGFQCKLNEMLIKSEASLEVKYTPFIFFIFSLTIAFEFLFDYRTKKFMIVFLVFYPPFIIYYSLLLSEYIDSKYIIIGLIIVGTEILSLLFNIFLRKFEIKYFILFSSVLSFLCLLFISIFWIKSWFPILYVSIFWLVTNIIYLSLIFTINKICELDEDESFYASIIFNYSIFLLFIYLLKFPASYLIDNGKNIQVKVTGIFLYQNIFIILFVWIGFSYEWNVNVKSDTLKGWLISINIIFVFVTCIHFLCAISEHIEHIESFDDYACLSTYHILYIPMMIIFYFLFSTIIEEKYILCYTFILFIELLSSFIYFFWLEDTSASLWILACSIFTGIYFTSILTAIKKYLDNKVFISVMALDYGIFSLILYFIYKFLICLKDCCKT